ncbi:MAG: peptidylprolyl isomerase [Clostridiales bacterium]|nr:peptidylprolyl isomerase [Clostridiales bacterium]
MGRKKVLALFTILFLLVLSIMGCGSNSSNKTVVARVNGEKITKGEFDKIYNQMKQGYGITEEMEQDPERKEMLKEFKAEILEQMVMEKLITQNAKKAGFEVTDEVLKDARTEFQGIISDLTFQMEAIDDGEEEKDYLKEAESYIDEQLKEIGQTREEFIESIAQQIAVERYIDTLVEDVRADDDEVREYYEEKLKDQQENPSGIHYDDIELYKPEEVRVKHVLVGLSPEDRDEYNDMVKEGKEEEAKKFLEDSLKAIEPKAQEVLDMAKAGEDFEKLVEEYGSDPGMENNDMGYIVPRGGDFAPEFEEASFKLTEGEISDIVVTDFGYHIIKLYERYPEMIYSMEDKQDEINDILTNIKKGDAWVVILKDWQETADIKKYEDKL